MKTEVFVSGEQSSIGGDVKQILVDDSLLFFRTRLSLALPLNWELNGSLSDMWLSGCMAVCVPEYCLHERVRQPWSPLSLSTGGGTLGITVVPVPAVR